MYHIWTGKALQGEQEIKMGCPQNCQRRQQAWYSHYIAVKRVISGKKCLTRIFSVDQMLRGVGSTNEHLILCSDSEATAFKGEYLNTKTGELKSKEHVPESSRSTH